MAHHNAKGETAILRNSYNTKQQTTEVPTTPASPFSTIDIAVISASTAENAQICNTTTSPRLVVT
jgi:hypothetical protein